MNIKEVLKSNKYNIMLLFLAFNYWLAYINMLPKSKAIAGFCDAGFMSHLTVVALFVSQFIFLYLTFKSESIKGFLKNISIIYILQIYFMREADFHTIVVNGDTMSMTNGKFYTHADISIALKCFSLFLLGLLAVAIGYVVLFYGKKFIKAFMNNEAWTIAFLMWGGLLFLSQLCDRWGVIRETNYWQIGTIEEMLEFTSSAFFASCTIQYLLAIRKKLSKN
ncbi:hypothetical protein AAEX28_00445 [Lentisphaerota bacterium WC36G]|nr:hypothetical protein LJT99_03325 [Lentisphaerae bacterium WC36]